MAVVKQEHALYLYKLLKATIGVSKQTPLSTVESVLIEDDLAPQDFGFDDIRALMEACPDFIKITAFKKGYVYATLLTFDIFEAALAAGEKNVEAQNNGKPWKRRRGAKSIRALKPKHLVAETEPETEELPTQEEPTETEEVPVAESSEELSVAETAPIAEESAVEAPVVATSCAEAPEEDLQQESADDAAPEPAGTADDASPEPDETETPAPESKTAEPTVPEPVVPEPTISLTVTYNPYDGSDEEKTLEAAPSVLQQAMSATSSASSITASESQTSTQVINQNEAPAPAPTYPADFEEELHVNNELLGILYQMAPVDANVLKQLEEDFKLAESSRALISKGGTFTFNTRYKKPQTDEVITATIRKSKRGALRPWTLLKLSVSADELQDQTIDVLHGLPKSGIASWEKLPAAAKQLPINPVDVVMSEAPISDWNALCTTYLSDAPSLQAAQACLSAAYVYRKNEQQLMHTDADFSLPVPAATPLLFDSERGFDDNSPLVQNALRAAKRGWRMAVELYNPSKHCIYLALPTTDGEKPLALVFDTSAEGPYHVVAALTIEEAYPLARIFSDGLPSWILPQ
ncbi:hypothetical protein [Lancefieldella parvula]|uniref:hypothetical protein n=1 Tax=Lancefieldella parvula TaxID=1382 RepID=UPI0028D8A533|nr:hypothetical protein [Lancefieldella parvula]